MVQVTVSRIIVGYGPFLVAFRPILYPMPEETAISTNIPNIVLSNSFIFLSKNPRRLEPGSHNNNQMNETNYTLLASRRLALMKKNQKTAQPTVCVYTANFQT